MKSKTLDGGINLTIAVLQFMPFYFCLVKELQPFQRCILGEWIHRQLWELNQKCLHLP